MNHQQTDKEAAPNENSDNMTPNDQLLEDALSQALNTDENISGQQLDEENEIEKLQAALDESNDKYIRKVAEFDNFKKRTARERIELFQTAGKEVIQSLLVVLDDTDRAAKQMEVSEDMATVKEGVMLVFHKLRNVLQQKGLKKMESLHQPFDADLHEAITEIPAPSKDLIGKVLDEIEPGYYLNEKLIRYAKVIVGS